MNRKKLLKIFTLLLVFVISFQCIAIPASAASDAESAPPTVNGVLETAEIITGKGEVGAMIIVIFPNGSAKTTIVKSDKTWETNVPDDVTLNSGDEISTIQIESGKSPSNVAITIVDPDITILPNINMSWESLATGRPYAKPGDLIEYQIEVWNDGRPSSVWQSAVAIVELDVNTTFTGSVKINGWNASSSQYSYDSNSHTLTVYMGNIVGGTGVNFSFRTRVNDDATVTELSIDVTLS